MTDEVKKIKSPGEVLYEAYGSSQNWVDVDSGHPILQWDYASPEKRRVFEIMGHYFKEHVSATLKNGEVSLGDLEWRIRDHYANQIKSMFDER